MRLFSLMTTVVLFLITNPLIGQEHPDEHPSDKQSKEKSLTIEEFADAAEKYIKKKTRRHDGYFPVRDEKQGKTLKLELDKVHRKRLSHLGDNKYFVCADFKGQDGNTYDIDIFMKGTTKENLKEAKKPMVHKVNGKERFTWHEHDGVWKRKEVGGKEEKKHEHPDDGHEHPDDGSEHPEHPNNN